VAALRRRLLIQRASPGSILPENFPRLRSTGFGQGVSWARQKHRLVIDQHYLECRLSATSYRQELRDQVGMVEACSRLARPVRPSDSARRVDGPDVATDLQGNEIPNDRARRAFGRALMGETRLALPERPKTIRGPHAVGFGAGRKSREPSWCTRLACRVLCQTSRLHQKDESPGTLVCRAERVAGPRARGAAAPTD
jgi:hypothetical protein